MDAGHLLQIFDDEYCNPSGTGYQGPTQSGCALGAHSPT